MPLGLVQMIYHRDSFVSHVLQIIGGSLFIAMCAQICIPLPFTPVPITGQTFAILLVGGLLGRKKGALSVLAYLAEITVGLPFLAGGLSKPLAMIGPSGGYLLGMVLQAGMVGWFAKRKTYTRNKLLAGSLLAVCLQLAMGAAWLSHFVGSENAFMMGVAPFIPGEIIKLIIAVMIIDKFKQYKEERINA